MMIEVSEKGVAFVCEICGWHTTDRPAAVWHATKAHGEATGGRAWPEGKAVGKAWRDMIEGAVKGHGTPSTGHESGRIDKQ